METWLMMVKVARHKAPVREAPKKRRRPTTHRLFRSDAREEHFALLVAAGY
jgi:hypothetical protein